MHRPLPFRLEDGDALAQAMPHRFDTSSADFSTWVLFFGPG